jgi:hypothetical protein
MSPRLVGGAAVLVAVVVVLAGTGLGWWNPGPAGAASTPALEVRTSLEPSPSFFGDPLVAQVVVELDTTTVDAASVQVDPGFAPYVESGAPAVTRSKAGREETQVYRYTIQCVTDACLPVGKPRQVQLSPVVVSAAAGKRRLRAIGRWQPTAVASRLTQTDVSASAGRFRKQVTVPPAAFAVSPGALAAVLTAGAVILALAALSVLALELARLAERGRRRAKGELTRLELALAYARDAASRLDPSDRRKAAGLLAETLAAEGRSGLAASAGDVAWSEAPPSPARTLTLVDEVEAERRA